MTIYEKIQYLCDNKGIKVSQLCKEAGVPKSTLSELKNQRTKSPSTATLSKIAQYFGITISYFDTVNDSVEDFRDEIFEKRKLLFDMSARVTEDQLDTFLAMFKTLIDDDSKGE